jgi:putative ABC transport system permease protein
MEEWERLNRRKRIYPEDVQAIEQRCESCDASSANLWFRDDIKYGNHTFYDANISGVDSELPKVQQLDIAEGRFMSSFDVDHARPIAIIGADIRDLFFATVEPLGKEIKIGGDSFLVIGVEKRNGTFFGQSLDSSIYIPYTAFLKKYGSRQSLSMKIRASSAKSLQATQDEVRVIMRSRHKLRPNEDDDFDILASETLQENIGQFTGAIAKVVTPITLISLIVGGIVIMNIMLVTVTERTREIGLRKSVGARRQDILLQFVVESSLLSAVGGLFGLVLAYAISFIIRRTTPIPMDITVGYILLALVASGGIGLLFGIYPAYKAAKLDPIVALSRE